jgi:N4-gp56 family major capsid protein
MAQVTSSTLSGQYQKHFSKDLLTYAVQALVMNQFAKKTPLPRNGGNKQVSWFRYDEPKASSVQTLTEGTPMSSTAYRTLALTEVTETLAQYGQVVELTDILSMTQLFDSIAQSVKVNGQDAALFMDDKMHEVLVAAASIERFGQGVADFATLSSGNQAAGKIGASDLLDAATNLKINRAPTIGGKYVGICPPQVCRDLQRDSDWLEAKKYSDVTDLYKGEVGSLHGVRVVEHTNPFVEDEVEDTRDEVDDNSDGLIYNNLILGGEAFGCTELSGTSAYAPSVQIVDTPDKSDPLNQKIDVGFKTFFAVKELNTNYYVDLRTKSTYA